MSLLQAAQQAGPSRATPLSPEKLEALGRWLVASGLVESPGPIGGVAPASLPTAGKARAFNPLYIRLSWGAPGRLIVDLDRTLGWLFTAPAIAVVALLSILAALQVAQNWERFTDSLGGVLCPDQHLTLLCCWLGLKIAHELGHAIACRRLGGEVREWGVAIIFLMPVPYVDATSSWRFGSRWDRMAVAAAGMYVEWLIALLAVAVWSASPSPALRQVCVYTISLATLTTMLFNANPLCRLDGYYLFSDLLHWPNLAEQGQSAARTWLQWVFWGDVTASYNIPPRRYWLALMYGVAAALWRLMSLVAMSIVVVLAYEGIGLLLLAGIGITWTWQSRKRLASQRWNPSLRVDRFTRLATRLTIGAVAIVMLAWLVPWPGAVRAPGIVESVERHVVRARTAGHVESLLVQNGQRVAAGQKLAVLRNAELELELRNLELAYELGEAKQRSLLTKRELVELQVQRQRQETLREQIEEQRRKLANLTLYSPAAGFVVARRLADLSGGFLAEGAELCLIVESGFEFRLAIAQRDMPYAIACVGKPIDVRLAGQRVAGTLQRLEPQASTTLLDAALGASAGGPLAVVPAKVHNSGSENPSTEWKLTEPRILAHVDLSAEDQATLFAGQRGFATLRAADFTVGTRFQRLASDWISRLKRRSN